MKLNAETLLVKLIAVSIVVTSSISVYLYYNYYSNLPVLPTDFHDKLLSVRIGILILVLGIAIGLFSHSIESIKGRLIIIFLTMVSFLIYADWYFEKFKWLDIIGLKENNPQYYATLNKIGWLRNANFFDYFVLWGILVIFAWVLCKITAVRIIGQIRPR